MTTQRVPFAFDSAYRIAAVPFGVLPAMTWVEVDAERLRARFGLWTLDTARANVKDVTTTGDYFSPDSDARTDTPLARG